MTEKKENILNLSGEWQIVFDPKDIGRSQEWYGAGWPEGLARQARVPEIWNIRYPDEEGVAFYQRSFTVPYDWNGRVIRLGFEGVMYFCEVWVNGVYLGSHEGGYTPFGFEITNHVRNGAESILTVRVMALSKNRAVAGMRLEHTPLSKQAWYFPFGGIWGKVSLEARPPISIQNVVITPSLRQEKVEVEVAILNRASSAGQVDLSFKVMAPDGRMVVEENHQVATLAGQIQPKFKLKIPRPLAWSVDHPNLYQLITQIRGFDGSLDEVQTSFGMRDFTMKEGRFFLNGEPFYLRGILLQPNYPVGLIQPQDREMMEREIRLSKEAGFNLIRLHLNSAPSEYLDLADRLGILIYDETCLAWIRDNPRLHEHGTREVAEMIARDRNHPSVVIWGIYNENPQAAAINGADLARLARSLDPSRVVIENSGGSLAIDQDFGWIDRAYVTPALETAPEKAMDVHFYLGSPISAPVYDWLRDMGTGATSCVLADSGLGSIPIFQEFDRELRSYQGKIFVSELGCGGMSDLDEQVAGFGEQTDLLDARELRILRDSMHAGFEERGLEKVFGSTENLYKEAQELQVIGNRQQLNALACNPRVSGYIITQLNDLSWEFHAGLLDVWRNPKPAYWAAREANQPNRIVLKARTPNGKAGESVGVDVTLVNEKMLPAGATAIILVKDPSGKDVIREEIPLIRQTGIHNFDPFIFTLEVSGEYVITSEMVYEGEAPRISSEKILSLDGADWSALKNRSVVILGKNPFAGGEIPQPSDQSEPDVVLAAFPGTLSEVEWDRLFDCVRKGTTAVIGALRPEDELANAKLIAQGIQLNLDLGIGSWMGCYHWAPQAEIFVGLPAGGLVKEPYTRVIPKYVMAEQGGEVLAGSLRNTQSRKESPRMLWYADIESVPLGEGKIIFCQYRIFENMQIDVLAKKMAFNLMAYASAIHPV